MRRIGRCVRSTGRALSSRCVQVMQGRHIYRDERTPKDAVAKTFRLDGIDYKGTVEETEGEFRLNNESYVKVDGRV